jgi:hypothetical protein
LARTGPFLARGDFAFSKQVTFRSINLLDDMYIVFKDDMGF